MSIQNLISSVNWDSIDVSSGKATRIPEALIGLMSNREEIREMSYWKLDNEVVLQSDLYEAAYFVIPILLEILTSLQNCDRTRVYKLLYEIANGYAPEEVTCRDRYGKIVPLQLGCQMELRKGQNTYSDDLSNNDSRVRVNARDILIIIEHSSQINGPETLLQ